jgi:hypothetical protein
MSDIAGEASDQHASSEYQTDEADDSAAHVMPQTLAVPIADRKFHDTTDIVGAPNRKVL